MSENNAPADVRFADVKAILDSLVAGRDYNRMRQRHNAPNFGWNTLDQLKGVIVYPDGPGGTAYPLIDMALVSAKRGEDTNLVKALRDPTGVDFYGRMPYAPPPGRYATDDEIKTIVDWLNAGMPE
jgi:hypothetical protein